MAPPALPLSPPAPDPRPPPFLPRPPHQSAAEDNSSSPFDRRTLVDRCAAGLLGAAAAVVVGGGGAAAAFAAETGTRQSPIAVVGAGGKLNEATAVSSILRGRTKNELANVTKAHIVSCLPFCLPGVGLFCVRRSYAHDANSAVYGNLVWGRDSRQSEAPAPPKAKNRWLLYCTSTALERAS